MSQDDQRNGVPSGEPHRGPRPQPQRGLSTTEATVGILGVAAITAIEIASAILHLILWVLGTIAACFVTLFMLAFGLVASVFESPGAQRRERRFPPSYLGAGGSTDGGQDQADGNLATQFARYCQNLYGQDAVPPDDRALVMNWVRNHGGVCWLDKHTGDHVVDFPDGSQARLGPNDVMKVISRGGPEGGF